VAAMKEKRRLSFIVGGAGAASVALVVLALMPPEVMAAILAMAALTGWAAASIALRID
jgi:hypothetical protein